MCLRSCSSTHQYAGLLYTQPAPFVSPQVNGSQHTVNDVKFQVVRLMRMLVGVCQTLEQVPDEVRGCRCCCCHCCPACMVSLLACLRGCYSGAVAQLPGLFISQLYLS
jgi:hypothetical protein